MLNQAKQQTNYLISVQRKVYKIKENANYQASVEDTRSEHKSFSFWRRFANL